MDLVALAITNMIALVVGYFTFAMLAINGERRKERWIKRAVPILREYYAGLIGQQAIPGRVGGKQLIDDVGRLLEEVKEGKGQED